MKVQELVTPAIENAELHAETLCKTHSGNCGVNNTTEETQEEEILF